LAVKPVSVFLLQSIPLHLKEEFHTFSIHSLYLCSS